MGRRGLGVLDLDVTLMVTRAGPDHVTAARGCKTIVQSLLVTFHCCAIVFVRGGEEGGKDIVNIDQESYIYHILPDTLTEVRWLTRCASPHMYTCLGVFPIPAH